MLKAAGRLTDGTPFVVLGLADDNWERLRTGAPIRVALKDISDRLPAVQVVLFGGATSDAILDDLRALGWLRGGPE